MPYNKVKDIAVAVSSYTDRNGNEKARWQTVGAMMKSEKGKFVIFLDRTFNPAGVPNPDGRESVMLNLFDPKPQGQSTGKTVKVPEQATMDDDEIPF